MEIKTAACPVRQQMTGILTCKEAYDCNHCGLFQSYFFNVANRIKWLCGICLSASEPETRKILGYYSEGICQDCGNTSIIRSATLVRPNHRALDVPGTVDV